MSKQVNVKQVLSEDQLVAVREEKLVNLTKLHNSYENKSVPVLNDSITCSIGELRNCARKANVNGKYKLEDIFELVKSQSYHIRGRVVACRSSGKISFMQLRDHTGEIQLMIFKNIIGDDYSYIDNIDVGDIIEVEGLLTSSVSGELSLSAYRIKVLTKALRPLPDKWNGLNNTEGRYRQRYLDLIASENTRNIFKARSYIISCIRAQLDNAQFMEVETPTLNTLVGGASAKPFITHHNALDTDLYLRVAPELYLKRLLVGGFDRVYEIGRCYRNEGLSSRHNPEFTLLELYQAYATYEHMLTFTEKFLKTLDLQLEVKMPDAYKSWKSDRTFTFAEQFAKVKMVDATYSAMNSLDVFKYFDRNNLSEMIETLDSFDKNSFLIFVEYFASIVERSRTVNWKEFANHYFNLKTNGEKIFACYEYFAEPFLTQDYRSKNGEHSLPVFIIDYPFEISPLARRKDDDLNFTERFELFVDGKELCNAFSELNNPKDQAERFKEQLNKKNAGDEEAMHYDADYITALEHGMPPAAGLGVGICRLVMILTNSNSIKETILFPTMRNIE